MADDWARLVNTTIREYLKGAEPNVLRNRKLLALLKERGRITFNHEGTQVDWAVQYKLPPMVGYGDSDTLTFARRDYWKRANLPWRGYSATDQMTEKEKLMNKGAAALIKSYSEIVPNLLEGMEQRFGDEMYIDGNASGNELRIHGFNSFSGLGSNSTKQPIVLLDDSYGGLDTDLAAYGGTWSTTGTTTTATDWPSGTGDEHYDFWSPLVVNYVSNITTDAAAGTTGWAATTKTWPNTCLEALRFGIIKSRKNKKKNGMLDVILLENELYRQFEDLADNNERLIVKRGDASAMYRLGFTDAVNLDGVDITYEYGIPTGNGYGFAVDQMELCSLQGQLFVPRGPIYAEETMSYRFSISFFGNLKFKSIRYFCKWINNGA